MTRMVQMVTMTIFALKYGQQQEVAVTDLSPDLLCVLI